jgi:hypothetical protein
MASLVSSVGGHWLRLSPGIRLFYACRTRVVALRVWGLLFPWVLPFW